MQETAESRSVSLFLNVTNKKDWRGVLSRPWPWIPKVGERGFKSVTSCSQIT